MLGLRRILVIRRCIDFSTSLVGLILDGRPAALAIAAWPGDWAGLFTAFCGPNAVPSPVSPFSCVGPAEGFRLTLVHGFRGRPIYLLPPYLRTAFVVRLTSCFRITFSPA